jgi:hypothetical protein
MDFEEITKGAIAIMGKKIKDSSSDRKYIKSENFIENESKYWGETEKPKEIPEEESTSHELIYPTFHLKNFGPLERATGLYGNPYKGIIKAIWYVLHGQIIKERIVSLGEIEADCRMNFALIVKSGRGKKEIEDVITKVCRGLGEKVTKPTSYHPEQLVGKVVYKEGEYQQIKGHLGDDILIFDDAIDLVKAQKVFYRESRRYITQALDPIGKNLVTKRQTGIPREETLQYYPACSIQILLQPFNVSDEVVKSGFFRRFLFLFPEIERSKEIFSQKTLSNGTLKSQALDTVLGHLKELREGGASPTLTFSKKAIERFNELHLLLVEFGEGYSKKVSSFTEMIDFALQNWFLKMIAILANSHKRNEASIFDVEMAFVDLLEFLDSDFEYVERKVQGPLDYEGQSQPTGDDLEMLQWLKQKGALSYKDSRISIKAYEKEMSKRFNISSRAARGRYQQHRWKGWVKGKQKGDHSSKVWLTIRLDGDEGEQGGKGGRVVAEYLKIIARYAKERAIPLLTPGETRLLPLLPPREEQVPPCHPIPPLGEDSPIPQESDEEAPCEDNVSESSFTDTLLGGCEGGMEVPLESTSS